MENEGPGFAIIDEDGVAFYIAKTYDEAVAIAAEVAPDADVWFDGPETAEAPVGERELRMAANSKRHLALVGDDDRGDDKGVDVTEDTSRAMKSLGLRPYSNEEILSLRPQEAWEELSPLFPTQKYRKSDNKLDTCTTKISAYADVKRMGQSFFGQNAKMVTGPRPGLPPSETVGLSLLPAQSWRQERVSQLIDLATRYGVKKSLGISQHINMCHGSTKACRNSCLVFSGYNFNDNYNTIKKYALTQALIHKPLAFLRMLYLNIDSYRTGVGRRTPFLRLNTYSDVPWEKLAPGMFAKYQDVQFYDYTKLAGRVPWDGSKYAIPNYDLTFSYGGTALNNARLDHEYRENKRRIAVTFALVGESSWYDTSSGKKVSVPKTPPTPGEKETKRRWPASAEAATARRRAGGRAWTKWVGLPEEFIGLKVIDGDQSDFRPYDPPFNVESKKYDLEPCVVGLRWKIPSGQRTSAATARLFIVPGHLMSDGKTFAIVDLPRYNQMFPPDAERKQPFTELPWEKILIEEAD
jgi:hypothetical protein